ncbi:MAG: hypothetical protein ACXVRK_07665 [Gaiellaceae bacterium]
MGSLLVHRRGRHHHRPGGDRHLFGLAIMLSVYYLPVLAYMIDRKRAVPLLLG